MSVFWVHAGSKPRFEKGYLDLAKEARIVGWNSPDPAIDKLQLVKDWLQGKASGNWILILDNADDVDLFYGESDALKRLADYFPRSSNGSILLTTRKKKVGTKFAFARELNLLHIKALAPLDSVDLLKAKIGGDDIENHDYASLASTLENVPLALVQAASFMSTESSSVSEYLNLYHQSGSSRIQLLSNSFEDDMRDRDSKNPVASTFAISFEHIKRSHPRAADILSFINTLDTQAIPTYIIPTDDDPVRFRKALETLQAFSLTTPTAQNEQHEESYDLHRLVCITMRNWLRMGGELEKWTNDAVVVLNQKFPGPDWSHDYHEICKTLLPHTLVLFSSDQMIIEQVAQAELICSVSSYLREIGKHELAEMLARQSLTRCEKALGPDHKETLRSRITLVVIVDALGKYELAEKMNQQTLDLHLKVLGREHVITMLFMHNLAMNLASGGKYQQAENMNR